MRQVGFRATPELVKEIDKHRARSAAETGDVQSRAEWMRDAAREKLEIDDTGDEDAADDGDATEVEAT